MISMRRKFHFFGLCFAGCLSALLKCAQSDSSHCQVNVTHGFHDNQPLILRHNASEFYYPRVQSPSSFEMNVGKSELRVVCPGDLLVADNETLGLGAAYLKCHGDANFGIAGSQVSTPFEKIGCSKALTPIIRTKRSNCPIGKCVQIGFMLNVFTFLPVIDSIAYDTENNVPFWAHAKIVSVIEGRQKSKERSEFRMGPLLQISTIEISEIYKRDYQHKRLRAIFDDPEEMEWYRNDMVEEDSKYFVEGQLITKDDFFYKSQQQSTYFYENVVPMWKSIYEGNWHYISSVIRRLASETLTDLDVWSGSIGILAMPAASEVRRKIYLTRDETGRSIVPAPKILYKYVYDRKTNRGIVFLVVNNPHLNKITADYVICKRQHVCESLFPQFFQIDKGYAYCCTVDGFLETAKNLGLPSFTGTTL